MPSMLNDLEALVTCESPSGDHRAIAHSADVVSAIARRLTGEVPERVVLNGCTHLALRFGPCPRILLLGHHDTVWPLGSLATHPWSATGGIARGPGCFDMKAGIVQLLHAIAALADPSGISVLITGDEEVGSTTSRALIEDEARTCQVVLVLEPSADGGALKIGRKGAATYQVQVRGRAAHAGLEPEHGANAAIELARQVFTIIDLAAPSLGTTVTPTLLSGGTTANTVPDSAQLSVDVRALLAQEQLRVDRALAQLRPHLAGTALLLDRQSHRPPMEPAASARLFDRAQTLAGELGLPPLSGVTVGGASDGNLTAAVGTETLDGLGAVGGGAHADDEYVVISEIPQRTALLARLIEDLRRDRPSAEYKEQNNS
ncbi:M20 family peptidase [Kribbella turkmenica]|uniref:M20 family peptidase n=1 Tax=Kribbella turkmenica TaxID=2530375 RepID=A0A4R4WKT2_9ACTN|nr:M20 family peptidase [Kribbella turkmenica]